MKKILLKSKKLFTHAILVRSTEEVLEEVKISFRDENKGGDGGLINIARTVLSRILSGSEGNLESLHNTNPQVICLVGVNGAGKTTTCAKLGYQLSSSGSSVMIGACDTFRAAATEQLKDWASRLNLDVVSGHHGSDAAAVAFDSYSSALAKNGLSTSGYCWKVTCKDHLMDELSKLKRVLQKREPCAPQHSWLVVDGSPTNGLLQAKTFHEKFGLSGMVVTKLDGTSKGGVIVSIYRELGIPIFYLGLGEQADDLQPFSVKNYLDSLLPTTFASMNA